MPYRFDDYKDSNMLDIPFGAYLTDEANKKAWLDRRATRRANQNLGRARANGGVAANNSTTNNAGGAFRMQHDPQGITTESRASPPHTSSEAAQRKKEVSEKQSLINRANSPMPSTPAVNIAGDYGGVATISDKNIRHLMMPIIHRSAVILSQMYLAHVKDPAKYPVPTVQKALDLTLHELGGRDVGNSNGAASKQNLNALVRGRLMNLLELDDNIDDKHPGSVQYNDLSIRKILEDNKKEIYTMVLNGAPHILKEMAEYGNKNKYGRNFPEIMKTSALKQFQKEVMDKTIATERSGRRRFIGRSREDVKGDETFDIKFKEPGAAGAPKGITMRAVRQDVMPFTPRRAQDLFPNKPYVDKLSPEEIETAKEIAQRIDDEKNTTGTVDYDALQDELANLPMDQMGKRHVISQIIYGDTGLLKRGWSADEMNALVNDAAITQIYRQPSHVTPSEERIGLKLAQVMLKNKKRLPGTLEDNIRQLQKAIAILDNRYYARDDCMFDERNHRWVPKEGAEPLDIKTWDPINQPAVSIDPPGDELIIDDKSMKRIAGVIVKELVKNGGMTKKEAANFARDKLTPMAKRTDKPYRWLGEGQQASDEDKWDTLWMIENHLNGINIFDVNHVKGPEPIERVKDGSSMFTKEVGRLNFNKTYVKQFIANPDNWFMLNENAGPEDAKKVRAFMDQILGVAEMYLADPTGEVAKRIALTRENLEKGGDGLWTGENPELAGAITRGLQGIAREMNKITANNREGKVAEYTKNLGNTVPVVTPLGKPVPKTAMSPEAQFRPTKVGANLAETKEEMRDHNKKLYPVNIPQGVKAGPTDAELKERYKVRNAMADADKLATSDAKQDLASGKLSQEAFDNIIARKAKMAEAQLIKEGYALPPQERKKLEDEIQAYREAQAKKKAEADQLKRHQKRFEDEYGYLDPDPEKYGDVLVYRTERPKFVRGKFTPSISYEGWMDQDENKDVREDIATHMKALDEAKERFRKFKVYAAAVNGHDKKWMAEMEEDALRKHNLKLAKEGKPPLNDEEALDFKVQAKLFYLKKLDGVKAEIKKKGLTKEGIVNEYFKRKDAVKSAKIALETVQTPSRIRYEKYIQPEEEEFDRKETERAIQERKDWETGVREGWKKDYAEGRTSNFPRRPSDPGEYAEDEEYAPAEYVPAPESKRETATEEERMEMIAARDRLRDAILKHNVSVDVDEGEDIDATVRKHVESIVRNEFRTQGIDLYDPGTRRMNPDVKKKIDERVEELIPEYQKKAQIFAQERRDNPDEDLKESYHRIGNMKGDFHTKYPWAYDPPYEVREKANREQYDKDEETRKRNWVESQDRKRKAHDAWRKYMLGKRDEWDSYYSDKFKGVRPEDPGEYVEEQYVPQEYVPLPTPKEEIEAYKTKWMKENPGKTITFFDGGPEARKRKEEEYKLKEEANRKKYDEEEAKRKKEWTKNQRLKRREHDEWRKFLLDKQKEYDEQPLQQPLQDRTNADEVKDKKEAKKKIQGKKEGPNSRKNRLKQEAEKKEKDKGSKSDDSDKSNKDKKTKQKQGDDSVTDDTSTNTPKKEVEEVMMETTVPSTKSAFSTTGFREMLKSANDKAWQERGLPTGAVMEKTLPAYYRTVKMSPEGDGVIGLSVYEHQQMPDSEGHGKMKTKEFSSMMEKPDDVTNGPVKKGLPTFRQMMGQEPIAKRWQDEPKGSAPGDELEDEIADYVYTQALKERANNNPHAEGVGYDGTSLKYDVEDEITPRNENEWDPTETAQINRWIDHEQDDPDRINSRTVAQTTRFTHPRTGEILADNTNAAEKRVLEDQIWRQKNLPRDENGFHIPDDFDEKYVWDPEKEEYVERASVDNETVESKKSIPSFREMLGLEPITKTKWNPANEYITDAKATGDPAVIGNAVADLVDMDNHVNSRINGDKMIENHVYRNGWIPTPNVNVPRSDDLKYGDEESEPVEFLERAQNAAYVGNAGGALEEDDSFIDETAPEDKIQDAALENLTRREMKTREAKENNDEKGRPYRPEKKPKYKTEKKHISVAASSEATPTEKSIPSFREMMGQESIQKMIMEPGANYARYAGDPKNKALLVKENMRDYKRKNDPLYDKEQWKKTSIHLPTQSLYTPGTNAPTDMNMRDYYNKYYDDGEDEPRWPMPKQARAEHLLNRMKEAEEQDKALEEYYNSLNEEDPNEEGDYESE